MTGLAGIFEKGNLDVQEDRTRSDVAEMANDLSYTTDNCRDLWSEGGTTFARVHHGVVNPSSQPVRADDSSLSLMFWGELFSKDRLKRRLRKDGSQVQREDDDGEFVLRLLEQYGYEILEELNGSFAIAFYDRAKRQLGLVSDRLCSRPIYYRETKDRVIFATEFGPVIEKSEGKLELDLQGVYEFFAFTHLLDDHTYYRSIRTVRPATVLTFDGKGKEEFSYWQHSYRPAGKSRGNPDEYSERLARTLKKAVNRRISSNESKTGLFLSGGLDARVALAAADKPLTTFTVGDRRNREARLAAEAAELAGVPNIFLERDADHYYSLIEEAVELGGGMHQFSDAHFLGLLGQVNDRCPVLLNTYGFDARLKGHFFPPRQIPWPGGKVSLSKTAGAISTEELFQAETWEKVPSSMLYRSPRKLFTPDHRGRFRLKVMESLSGLLEEADTANPYNLVEFPAVSSFRSLSTYLMVMSSRAYLPQRSIVLDSDLIDLSLSMPPRLRANGYAIKQALKKLSPELGRLKNSDTGIRADAPKWLEFTVLNFRTLCRKYLNIWTGTEEYPTQTQGSWPHWPELIRRNDSIRGKFRSLVEDPGALPPQIFDRDRVKGLFGRHIQREEDNSRLLISLVTFGLWYRKYGP